MTRLPRSASAFASGSCIRWLSSSPCRSTTIREPSPYSLYASVRPSWRNVVIPAVPNLSACRRFLLTSMMPYRWGILRPCGVSLAPAAARARRCCCASPPTSGSSRSCAAGARRPSRRSTTATTAASSRSAATCCPRPHEAEDAVQHTFMAAYRHLVGGAAEIQLRPWLYTIARNRCLSMLRARRERPLDELREPATEHLSAEAQRRQDVRELLGDVAALPEDQRAALVLAELGAVSHDEIAMVLDVPRQKVKALVFQARTSLIASRDGARHAVRRDPRAAREPPRRRAAAHDAAPPPARVPGLPGVPRGGRAAAQDAGGRAAGAPDAGAQGGCARRGLRLRRSGRRRRGRGHGRRDRGEGARRGRAGRRRHDGRRRGRAPLHAAGAEGCRARTDGRAGGRGGARASACPPSPARCSPRGARPGSAAPRHARQAPQPRQGEARGPGPGQARQGEPRRPRAGEEGRADQAGAREAPAAKPQKVAKGQTKVKAVPPGQAKKTDRRPPSPSPKARAEGPGQARSSRRSRSPPSSPRLKANGKLR